MWLLGKTDQLLAAGQLLYLGGGVVHDVTALDDASALVTIVLQPAVRRS